MQSVLVSDFINNHANSESLHQLSAVELVQSITKLVGKDSYPLWLHNQGQEVIGVCPTWLVTVKTCSPSQEQSQKQLQQIIQKKRTLSSSDSAHVNLTAEYSVTDTQSFTPEIFANIIDSYACNKTASTNNISEKNSSTNTSSANFLTFTGGLLGYFDYDSTAQITAPNLTACDQAVFENRATMFFGHYDVFFERKNNQWYCCYEEGQEQLAQHICKCITAATNENATAALRIQPITAHTTQDQYRQQFTQVQNYLKAGDCYQINLAQKFSASYTGDVVEILPRLHAKTRAPFSGYACIDDYEIISCSPELFIEFTHNQEGQHCITTKPIKGTLPRLADPVEDAKQVQRLKESGKNCAENLMIVDLLRNDLSVYAKTGSVKVPKLFEIESFAQVHHMVSTITATLEEKQNLVTLLLRALPGGSITGAPKVRAIEIIRELEQQPRGSYCGSMGFINFDGTGSFNILIRTLECYKQQLSLWAGGGITIASDCDEEYQECFDKVNGILEVIKGFE